MTRDARLSALHRGDFGLPGPRFRLLRRPPSYNGGQVPSGSVQRAPRTQVVVPGGRGPCLPRRAVTSSRRRTPRLTPHSGSSLEHALSERGCVSSSIGTIRSQWRSWGVVKKISPNMMRRHGRANGCAVMAGHSAFIPVVIAGLDPAIHPLRKKFLRGMMDPRVKPAGDDAVSGSDDFRRDRGRPTSPSPRRRADRAPCSSPR